MNGLTAPRHTAKHQLVRSLADYIVEAFSPETEPRVLMWREILQGHSAKVSPDAPNLWTRDGSTVFNHWKACGRDVCRTIEDRYKVTIIRVSRDIRRYVSHGSIPKRDNTRSDQFYRDCLPSSQHPTAGIVCFPRDAFMDHPLVVEYMARRGQASSTAVHNTVRKIDRAEGNGNLSTDRNVEIKNKIGLVVNGALEDQHPLFAPKAIEHDPVITEAKGEPQ